MSPFIPPFCLIEAVSGIGDADLSTAADVVPMQTMNVRRDGYVGTVRSVHAMQRQRHPLRQKTALWTIADELQD